MNRYFGLHTLEGEWHALLPRYLYVGHQLQGMHVLDIGCGTGLGASLLLELGVAKVSAIDHRPVVLELAKVKHSKPDLQFYNMLWEDLDFENDTFDAVLCLDSAAPVTDHNLLLEISRVLKPHGHYICAIERHKRTGFESILPRYGYKDTAEHLAISRATGNAPQLGRLTEHFQYILPVLQTPQLIYDFMPAAAASSDNAVIRSELTDGEGAGDSWNVLRELNADFSHEASTEILVCSRESLAFASDRNAVELSYYSLVERIQAMFSEMRNQQTYSESLPGWQSVHDTSTEPPDFSERQKTTRYDSIKNWSEPPTTVHTRSISASSETFVENRRDQPDQLQQLQEQFQQMTILYEAIRDQLESQLNQTQHVLEERNRYIDHLVGKIYQWEEFFHNQEDTVRLPVPPKKEQDNESILAPLENGEADEPDDGQDRLSRTPSELESELTRLGVEHSKLLALLQDQGKQPSLSTNEEASTNDDSLALDEDDRVQDQNEASASIAHDDRADEESDEDAESNTEESDYSLEEQSSEK